MDEQQVFLTREGYRKLEEELHYLRTVRRQEVAERLRAAQEDGEVLENAEYDDAKNEQAFLEGRILELETILRNAVIIDEESHRRDVVGLGCQVTITEVEGGEPETYHIVGSAEAEPGRGYISYLSPLGKALLGHKVGDEVTVDAPDGELHFRIVDIQ